MNLNLIERRKTEVDQALQVLGLHGTQVLLTTDVKYAVCNSVIKINPNLPDKEFWVTLNHELLHDLGVPHNECTRRIGYSSKNLENDTLSAAFAQVVHERIVQRRIELAEKKISEGQTGFDAKQ